MPLWLTILLAVTGFIVQLVGLLTIVTRSVKGWFREEINGLGQRLGHEIKDLRSLQQALEREASAVDQATGDLAKKALQQEFQIAALQQSTGELRGSFNQLLTEIKASREIQHEHEKDLIKQLASLETHMDVAQALREGFERLGTILKG